MAVNLIDLVYSGGGQNTKQQNSLGGFPSPVEIPPTKNNLFNDVTAQQTTQGKTDYRCIYIFNDDDNFKYDVTISIEYLTETGATIELGYLSINSVQTLEFTNPAVGGDFTITVQGLTSDVIQWDSDSSVLATNIQTALQTVTDCEVEVITPGQFYFSIIFKGNLGNKTLTTFTVTNNNLTPLGTITPTIIQTVQGSPINSIAPDTGLENVNPTGISFVQILSPGVLIGTLYPAEGFPLWVKRIVAADSEAVENDGFVLQIEAVGLVLS